MTRVAAQEPSIAPAPSGRWGRALERGAAARGRRQFGLLFALFAVWSAVWSLSVPLFSAPDEHAHVIRAAGVVRGDMLGREVRFPGPPYVATEVQVPAIYSEAENTFSCYVHRPEVSAACAPTFDGPRGSTGVATLAGRYPPLYYAVVGLPSLLSPTGPGVYAMRLLSGVLSAWFLAWAVLSVLDSSARRRLLLGLVIAVTPAILYLGGVVNPNGLEAAAAVCAWTSGLALFATLSQAGPAGVLLRRFGVSTCVLMSCRGLGPLWVVLLTAGLLASSNRSRVAEVLGDVRARSWVALVVVSGAVAGAWSLAARPFDFAVSPRGLGLFERLTTSLDRSGAFLQDMVGVFGFHDAPAPFLTYAVWSLLVGAVVALAFAGGRRRSVVTLFVAVSAVLLIPVVLEAQAFNAVGYSFWQGRYTLPVAVGIPLLATLAATGRGASVLASRRVALTAGGLALVAHLGAYVWVARRYTVGSSGPIVYVLDPHWSPPVPAWALLLLMVGVAGTTLAVIVRLHSFLTAARRVGP